MKILIVFNRSKIEEFVKEGIFSVILNEDEIDFFLLEKDYEIISKFIDKDLKINILSSEDGISKKIDFIFSIGGDGTVLKAVREINYPQIPIVGLKKGKLGFLTFDDIYNIDKIIKKLKKKEFFIEKRKLLEINFKGKKQFALNDVVIEREDLARMIHINVYVNGEFFTTYYSNGIIISTPTGSTAYNLSAGGPITSPELDCFILTPICPHSLIHRPIIFDKKTTLSFKTLDKNIDPVLTLDGQVAKRIKENDKIEITLSEKYILLVRDLSQKFPFVLKEKFDWR